MALYERDYSLDFAKGIAILSVIFLHNLPNHHIGSIAWIGQAVPLFLLITGYLTYSGFERGKTIKNYFSFGNIHNMLNRIFVPFLVITATQCLIYYFFADFSFYRLIRDGGIGPGSYYPWLYIQFWVLLPFIIKIIDTLSIPQSILLFIGLSVVLELLTCILNIPPALYRLLCYKYLFVVVLGCIAKKAKITMNSLLILLAGISLSFSLVEIYTSLDLEPFFTTQWKGYHWITAFYPLFLFVLIRQIYIRTGPTKVKSLFVLLGKYSYEIFLCQMFIYSIFPVFFSLESIEDLYIRKMVYIISTTLLSILPILCYKLWLKPLIRIFFKHII